MRPVVLLASVGWVGDSSSSRPSHAMMLMRTVVRAGQSGGTGEQLGGEGTGGRSSGSTLPQHNNTLLAAASSSIPQDVRSSVGSLVRSS